MNIQRRSLAAPILAVSLLFAACSGDSQRESNSSAALAELRDSLNARIAQVPGAAVGLMFVNPSSGDTLAINADSSFHAASTMKVPVLIELFRRQDAGLLDVDSSMVLRNEFRSVFDGSTYSLPNTSDSDSSLYAQVGGAVPLRELARVMIVRSSNLATNVLIDTLGAAAIQATTDSLGASGMRVLRGVEDLKAFEAGMSNTTTARALATLFLAIEEGRAASPAATEQMLEILLAQELNRQIPAGLPPGTRVAHKTGSITRIMHDAGIIYPEGGEPYVLAILTGGIDDEDLARALAADLTRQIHDYVRVRNEG